MVISTDFLEIPTVNLLATVDFMDQKTSIEIHKPASNAPRKDPIVRKHGDQYPPDDVAPYLQF